MRTRTFGTVAAIVAAGLALVTAPAGSAQAADLDTFHGQAPQRALDTRPGATTVDGSAAGIGAVPPGGTIEIPIVSRAGVPATGVGAVALNVTVAGATGSGYLTVWPTGAPRPTASNLNFVAGQTVPNMVIVKPGSGGEASIYNGGTGTVHVIADVLGWFPAGPGYTGLTPARVLDTRPGAPTVDGSFAGVGARSGGDTTALVVRGRGGVPLDAAAVALNVTATNPTSVGYLTVFPTGSARPTASNLNFTPAQTVPNMVIVPLGADGTISIHNGGTGPTDVIVDVLGWFAGGSSFSGLTPARLMDTRTGAPTIDARYGGGNPVQEAQHYNLAVAGRGGVPFGAGAVALNVTVTSPNRPGYLTIKPQGAASPNASNLNFAAGQTVANMVLVPLGGSGQITMVLVDGAPNEFLDAEVQVIVDVLGWFPNPTDPPTGYGNDLVLRSNGLGAAVFGDAPASVIPLVASVLGPVTYDDVRLFSTPDDGGYLNPAEEEWFDYPVARVVCFNNGDAFCATFGGASVATVTFVGWDYGVGDAGTRLLDTNGLGLGSRGSNLPGTIAVVGHGGCYVYGSGTAASGIELGLVSDGLAFGVPDGAGNVSYHTPPQSDVRVEGMWAGAQIAYLYGDC